MLCLKCQYSFCQKCIDNWSKSNDVCPNKCNEPNYQKSLGKIEILSKLKFKCKKCGGEYYYQEIRKHNDNCDSISPLNNMIKAKKINRISAEEAFKFKKNGQDVTYISGKK